MDFGDSQQGEVTMAGASLVLQQEEVVVVARSYPLPVPSELGHSSP